MAINVIEIELDRKNQERKVYVMLKDDCIKFLNKLEDDLPFKKEIIAWVTQGKVIKILLINRKENTPLIYCIPEIPTRKKAKQIISDEISKWDEDIVFNYQSESKCFELDASIKSLTLFNDPLSKAIMASNNPLLGCDGKPHSDEFLKERIPELEKEQDFELAKIYLDELNRRKAKRKYWKRTME